MKKLISLLLLALPVVANAQGEALIVSSSTVSFDSAAAFTVAQMMADDPTDTTEGGDVRAFNRWARFYRNRVPMDASANVNVMEEVSDALFYYMNNLDVYCSSDPDIYTGNWALLGPNNNYWGSGITERQGRIDALWADPNDMGYILAGSNMGGLWKSTDTGHTWVNITDPSPTNNSVIPGTMGATRIAVNPLDRDTIYISLGIMGTLRKHSGYAMGLMYTHDGGQTWNYDNNFINANQQTDIAYYEKWVRQVKYMPGTGELFAISNNKVLHKPAGILGWYDITPDSLALGYIFTDMEFSKQNPGKLIVSTNAKNNISSLWVIDMTVTTPTWQELQITLPSPFSQNDGDYIVDVSISGDDTAYLNMEARVAGAKRLILAKTPIDVSDIDVINNNFLTAAEFIEVSPSNSNIIYASVHDQSTSFYRSTDGGATFPSIFAASHADGRCLFVYETTNTANGINDIVFAGSDGGVVLKRAGDSVYRSITGTGLAITQFYGLSNTEAHEGLVIGGTQDNNGMTYIRDRATPWASIFRGDNFMAKFANNGITDAYIEGNPDDVIARVTFNTTTNSAAWSSVGTPNDLGNPACIYCEQNNMQRPLYFDPSNDAFVGYLHVWSKPLASGTWTDAFGSFPGPWGKTRGFAISEPNQDTVYVAYEDGAGGNPTPPNGNSIGKLHRSDNSNLAPPNGTPTWNNITPPQVQYHGITSLVTDPRTMKRLWVSLGNIGANDPYNPAIMVNKVVYSGDYGNTWLDISRGLPPVPVNKLLYLEGSDDILFAGTDAGVFRWNKTDSTWYCFNTGLPPVVVNDMEFNYCAGKLRIATFGRGIWETPAFDNNYVSNPSNVISSNTTWASTRYLKSGVKVTNGATLTVQNTGQDQTIIRMPKNASIVVEPGAQLVVNGARITNGCEDCMWNGIRLVGQTNQPQSAANQGKLVLSNGAVIEHAKIGVANYGPDTPTFSNTGGIIDAVDAIFLNNARAVSLQPYRHQGGWSPVLKNYLASFAECDFIINNDFKGGTTNRFLSHVDMREVDGVRFSGIGMYNRNTGGSYQGEGDGITASNSGFRIKAACTSLSLPCTSLRRSRFTGLRTGVWMQYDNERMPYAAYIDRSNFDSCAVGIRSVGYHWFTASRDSFRMGYGKTTFLDPLDCHKNIGIWSEHSYFAHIEGNHFEGFTHGGQHPYHENIGTITDNSFSSAANNWSGNNLQIYRNTFLNLSRACYARGVNSDAGLYYSSNPAGLRYLCNTFDDNTHDIVVKAMSMHGNNVVQSIAYNQGSPNQSAGNQFLDRSSINHLLNVTDGAPGTFSYYHTTGNYVPILHTNWPWNSIALYHTSNAHSCTSTLSAESGGSGLDFPLSSSGLGTIKASFFVAKGNREVLQGTFDALIDGGNTDALLNYISGSTQADSPTVRTTLLGYSPYLTIPVLQAVADANILYQDALMQILEANPEMLRDEALLDHLQYNIPNPLPGAQIDQLRMTSENSSARSDTQAEIADYATTMDWCGMMILNHYLLDTTSDDRDSIPVWLDNINTLRSNYLKVAFYTGMGDYTTAASILEDIPETYELTGDQATEHGLYVDLWQLLKYIDDDDRLLRDMTPEELTELQTISDNPVATGRLIGTQVDVVRDVPIPQLHLACDADFTIGELKPGKRAGNGNIRENYRNQGIRSKNNIVKVYPNPAKDFVVFEYKLQQKSGNMSLHITNATGQKIKEIKLDGLSNKTEWETQSIPAGVYIYELKNGNASVDVGRIVITK